MVPYKRSYRPWAQKRKWKLKQLSRIRGQLRKMSRDPILTNTEKKDVTEAFKIIDRLCVFYKNGNRESKIDWGVVT